MAGLTAQGFEGKTFSEIQTSLRSLFRTALGQEIDVTTAGPLGQLIDILANAITENWELGEAVYAALSPDTASGAALDNVAALTGTFRLPARPSTVTLTLTGVDATLVPAGSTASAPVAASRFDTEFDATLATATSWLSSTAYTLGTIVTNSGKIYVCVGAGTSASSGGPSASGSGEVDGSVTWNWVGNGTAYTQVLAVCETNGPVLGNAYTVTVIETPIAGWASVVNLLDADLGGDAEIDADLRARREVELSTSGLATPDAIRAHVLAVSGVTAVRVFRNDSDTTDGGSRPPHSVEVLAEGGTDQDVGTAVYASVAGGIKAFGTTSVSVIDSAGYTQTTAFTRPTNTNIYVRVDLTFDASTYPTDGDSQVEAAIVTFGDSFSVGKDAVASGISAQAFKVAGVLDVTICYIGTAPSPSSSATITVDDHHKATFDTSRITVNSTPGTP